jgi:hypothetical protein
MAEGPWRVKEGLTLLHTRSLLAVRKKRRFLSFTLKMPR